MSGYINFTRNLCDYNTTFYKYIFYYVYYCCVIDSVNMLSGSVFLFQFDITLQAVSLDGFQKNLARHQGPVAHDVIVLVFLPLI